MLNILTNGWRLLTLKAGPNMFFHIFCRFLQVFDAKVMKIRGKIQQGIMSSVGTMVPVPRKEQVLGVGECEKKSN